MESNEIEITENLKTLQSNTIDISITHDVHILVYLFYWAGILLSERWIQYLDGFILQFKEDTLKVYYRNGVKENKYPVWWNKKTKS